MIKRRKVTQLTPFQCQIVEFKAQNPDTILLFESGYQYKLYAQDAIAIGKSLNYTIRPGWESTEDTTNGKYRTFATITMTKHSVDTALQGLIGRGFKVGIISQIIDKSGEIKRELNQIYSPGTYQQGINQSIIFIIENGNSISFIAFNVFLGGIIYDEFADNITRLELNTRLMYLEPIEIILLGTYQNETRKIIKSFKSSQSPDVSSMIRICTKLDFESDISQILPQLAKCGFSADVFSIISNFSESVLICFNELSNFLKEFKLNQSILNHAEFYKDFKHLKIKSILLDSVILRNLEIFQNNTNFNQDGSLMSFLDETNTKMGKRLLSEWIRRPLTDSEEINRRHSLVESIIKKIESNQMKKIFNLIQRSNGLDLQLINNKILNLKGNRTEVYKLLKFIEDCFSIFRLSSLNESLYQIESLDSRELCELFRALIQLVNDDWVMKLLKLKNYIYSPAAIDSNDTQSHTFEYFIGSYPRGEALNLLKFRKESIKKEIEEELNLIKHRIKKPYLKWTFITQGQYLVTVRQNEADDVPADWIRRHSTINTVSFITPNTLILLDKLTEIDNEITLEANNLFNLFMVEINEFNVHLEQLINLMAEFEVLISFAKVSINHRLTRPKLIDSPVITLHECRNPIILKFSPKGNEMISNDIHFKDINIMSGPNMGGKSTLMRSIGLNVILNQIGCFIACSAGSEIGIFEKFIVRLGGQLDSLTQSTFEIEMLECKEIFKFVEGSDEGNSLILLDEIGRGTSSIDGNCIAWSVIDYLKECKNLLVIFITHFNDLQFSNSPRIKNFHMGYNVIRDGLIIDEQEGVENELGINDDLMFTYKLKEGKSSGSFGVYCGLLAGIEKDIIEEAYRISSEQEVKYKRIELYRLINSLISGDLLSAIDDRGLDK